MYRKILHPNSNYSIGKIPIQCCIFAQYYLRYYNIDPGKPAAEVSQT